MINFKISTLKCLINGGTLINFSIFFIYLDLLSLLICLILLIITLFLLASLLVCLLTLRLNINVKHLCLFFHPSLILTDILKFRQVFYKNFADVTRKYLCRSLFLIKLQALEHLFIEPPGQPLLQVEVSNRQF